MNEKIMHNKKASNNISFWLLVNIIPRSFYFFDLN